MSHNIYMIKNTALLSSSITKECFTSLVLKHFVKLIIRDMIYMIIMAFNSKEHNSDRHISITASFVDWPDSAAPGLIGVRA